MANGSYKTHTLGWQIRQTVQRMQEWVDYQFSKINIDGPDLPKWTWSEELAKVLFWVLVVALGLWLSWLLYRVAQHYWRQRQERAGQSVSVRSVPVPNQRSALEWWREANALAQANRYREACRALYMAALQRLHERKIIGDNPSRTDGEYLAAIATQPQPRPYELLIRTHERTEFGNAAVSAETYQRCRQAYREIDQA